jgi:Kef-type K+ transport system membrane component KefB
VDVLIADVIGEVALVLVVSWVLGGVAGRLGQPRVIGQILAGILLGPTLLGQLPGHLTAHVFPEATLPPMTVLANVAVVIFMFVVGYELDVRPLRGVRRAVPLVAVAALGVPMALGIGAALGFRPDFAALGGPRQVSVPFVLFMGVAVSITALPVLASIVRDRGIAGTTAGVTATASAGVMDAVAWLVLAAAVLGATHKSAGRPLPVTVALLAAFVAVMFLVVRPALRWWLGQRRSVLASPLPVALALALGSAWVTATLGLHPVFGGFLAGLAMPRLEGGADPDVLRPMEEVGGLLLPLFFVVTGLSLSIGGLGGTAAWVLVLICVIASAGKAVPAYAAARLGGLGHRDAAAVATLVNTRGLTELIALNVGLADGILSRSLFTVLVFMALIMTIATAPILTWFKLDTPAEPWPAGAPAVTPSPAPEP